MPEPEVWAEILVTVIMKHLYNLIDKRLKRKILDESKESSIIPVRRLLSDEREERIDLLKWVYSCRYARVDILHQWPV